MGRFQHAHIAGSHSHGMHSLTHTQENNNISLAQCGGLEKHQLLGQVQLCLVWCAGIQYKESGVCSKTLTALQT